MDTSGRLYESYYSNKNAREIINYNNNGERHGKYVLFYINGSKKEECNYINGKIDGIYTMYYENENVNKEISYMNGLKHGPSAEYDINGRVTKNIRFYDGKEEPTSCNIM